MAWTCEQLAKRWTELEEGDASTTERVVARLHLALCRRCARYVEQLQRTRDALRELREDEPLDESAVVAARARYAAWASSPRD